MAVEDRAQRSAGPVENPLDPADAAFERADATAAATELLRMAEERGVRHFVACTTPDNVPSLALIRGLGFEQTGVIRSAGWKFDRWLDVVMMQRGLGLGDGTAPADGA